MSVSQNSAAIREPARGAVSQSAIVMDRVNKWYGTMHVLRDVSITIGHGEKSWSAARQAPANPP